MDTLQPVLKCGRNTWDKINMPVSEFYQRVDNLRKRMKEEGIDVLLLYGHGFDSYGNYCYVSNYVIRLPQGALVVLPLEGEPVLIFEGASRGIPSIRKTTWIEQIRSTNNVATECLKYLKEKNLLTHTIGFVGLKRSMPYHQVDLLLRSLQNCKIIEADAMVDELRMRKSQMEILQIRRASRIVQWVFERLSETTFSSAKENVIEAVIRKEARLEGAEDFRAMIGRHFNGGWALRPCGETEVRPGERVAICILVQFERYWAEGIRMFTHEQGLFVPFESEDLKSIYASLLERLVPQKKISQFFLQALQSIKNSQLDYISEYGLGSGIGLSPKEAPFLDEKTDTYLSENMCFALRLCVTGKDRNPYVMAHTVLVSSQGAEILDA